MEIKLFDVNQYDIIYDLQYAEFMVKLLEKYIKFNPGTQLDIIKIEDKTKMEINEFLYFIQCILPRNILNEIENIFKVIKGFEIEKEIYETINRVKTGTDQTIFNMPYLIDSVDIDRYKDILNEMNKYDPSELKKLKEYYGKGMDSEYNIELSEHRYRYEYLKDINKILKEKNNTIEKVMALLSNINILISENNKYTK